MSAGPGGAGEGAGGAGAPEIAAWLDAAACPAERPPLAAMAATTRELHAAIDAHARRAGVPYLHPSDPTVQLDLLGSARVVAWQEGKGELMFLGEGCWSELPHLYARYGTTLTGRLLARLRELEQAQAVLLCDSGMQATALVLDALMAPGGHAVLMRQVYNKTRVYLEWLAQRLGGAVTIVDDGDHAALAAAIRAETRLVYAETYTNPLMRAQDLGALPRLVAEGRRRAPGLKLVIDSTIATPWGLRRPLLDAGVDVVVASGTKALGGQDRDLSGYVATRDPSLGNAVMDLVAMRGGILDWRRAAAIAEGLDAAPAAHARRCDGATRVAAFLAAHPKVSEVFHPSLASHPDAAAIARDYVRPGSIVSFRVAGADEERTRHVADVLATCVVVRYALSFDGLTTKVNHHKTVSEYFTPADQLARNGFDRLIRLAVGLEDPDDLIAALNWTLHHADAVTAADVAAWQRTRAADLGLPPA
ncbi:MAG: PLP-dependent transferase [Kofleriaceae bacterium]|nr:PLP-dependent transferase [Kofleriaceae bacterium]